jgi:acetyl esterase/lipase
VAVAVVRFDFGFGCVSVLKRISLLLIVFLLSFGNQAFAQAGKVMRDVPYVERGSIHQKLDLFVPPNVVSPPLVFYIHGGGWLTGDKNDVPPFLVQAGYAVVSINMRPTTEARYPAQYDDCVAALHWCRENAKKYEFDADRIIVLGISSGAHLSALMGSREYPGREFVKCVVDVSGPINLLSIVAHAHPAVPGQMVFASPKGQLAAFIGGPPLKNSAAALQASPVTYVNPKSAPTLIVHGGMDEIIPYEQATEYHRRLDIMGVKNDLVMVPTAAHNMPATLWAQYFSLFCDRYVTPPKKTNVAVAKPKPVKVEPVFIPSSPWLARPPALVEAPPAAKAAAPGQNSTAGKATTQGQGSTAGKVATQGQSPSQRKPAVQGQTGDQTATQAQGSGDSTANEIGFRAHHRRAIQ